MAIESSNRSPSPMSSRQTPNPNFSDPKRGESGVRRSANGSPFPKPSVVSHPSAWCFTPKTTTPTTASSPADIGKRNSFSSMNEHKENKKPNPNLKPAKGAKNFMSPTISAVSKVNPSPRKKALAERNEAVRTSASLSDGKFLFFAGIGDDDLKSEAGSCDFQEETTISTCGAKKRVTFDDDVVVLSPEVFSGYDVHEHSESLFDTQMVEPINFALDEIKEPSLDVGKTSSFVSLASPIAPLDADPSVQPYDPKTNFLSPRPQFLRYKPPENVFLDLNSHLHMSFEDRLSSETCSDNDGESSVEEVQSEEALLHKEEFLGSSNSSPSAKLEFSDECVVNPHEEEVCAESDEECSVESEEETFDESEIASEPRFFSRGRIINWLLFGALLSSLFVIHGPPEGADFSGSLHKVKEWSTTNLPFMISSFGEIDESTTPSEFLNISASICDANDHFIERKASGFPIEEVKYLAEIGNGVKEMPLLQFEEDIQYVAQIEQAEVGYSDEDQFVEESELPSHPEAEANHEEVEAQSEESELPKLDDPELEMDVAPEEVHFINHEEVEEAHFINHEEVEAQSEESELFKLDEPELEMDVAHEDAHFIKQTEKQEEVEPELEMDVAPEEAHFIKQTEKEEEVDLEEPIFYNTVVESGKAVAPAYGVVMSIFASLGAAVALLMFLKYKKKDRVELISTEQAELLINKEEDPSRSRMDAAESFNPSEMSSYSYSFYDNKREEEEARGSDSEAESKDERKQQPRRNNKRESLASSSSEYSRGGSLSYGSFTTYSVIPAKKGDASAVTPVRRSSRISKQLVTP